jgi:hypothetical protein
MGTTMQVIKGLENKGKIFLSKWIFVSLVGFRKYEL